LAHFLSFRGSGAPTFVAGASQLKFHDCSARREEYTYASTP
jgi:hypothetical protein